MARRPLTRKWNPLIHKKVKDYLKAARVRSRLSRSPIPSGLTMPDPSAIAIGGAKKMDAAILFLISKTSRKNLQPFHRNRLWHF